MRCTDMNRPLITPGLRNNASLAGAGAGAGGAAGGGGAGGGLMAGLLDDPEVKEALKNPKVISPSMLHRCCIDALPCVPRLFLLASAPRPGEERKRGE